jgi:endonuclease YncB( thermonuclease family)
MRRRSLQPRKQRRWTLRRRETNALIGLCVISFVALAQIFAAGDSRADLPAVTYTLVSAGGFRAVDGDTLVQVSTGETIRVANIDTAETGERARCGAERRHGELAERRVRELVERDVEVQRLGRTDRYGRTLAYVSVDRRDLGEMLISEHLARPWRGRREAWCGENGRLLP